MKSKEIVMLFVLIFVSFLSHGQDIAQIKERAVQAMGGQRAYDQTRYLSWNFFGSRNLIWDKHQQRLRIDFVKEPTVMLLNLKTMTGRVLKKGEEIVQPDSLAKYLEEARKIWINDSYWLVMPFKLSDPGVSLVYIGKRMTEDKQNADVLEMTFDKVGVTPNNKYHVFFDEKTGLVSQWSFFGNYNDATPRFTLPWKEYKPYGKIMLSGNRGTRQLSEIAVFKKLDDTIFENFNKPKFIK